MLMHQNSAVLESGNYYCDRPRFRRKLCKELPITTLSVEDI